MPAMDSQVFNAVPSKTLLTALLGYFDLLTLTFSLKLHIDQNSIHWATWGRLNKHCNSGNLLVMKRRTTAISAIHQPSFSPRFNFDCGFIHVSFVWPNAKFNAEANKPYWKSNWNNRHQVMDHFIKVYKGFACLFNEKLITWRVLASCFSTKGKALGIIVTYYITSRMK